MTPLWYAAFWVGFIALGLSCIASVTSIRWNSARSVALTAGGIVAGIPGPNQPRVRPRLFGIGLTLAWFSAAAFLVSLLARTLASEAPPMSTMWGYFLALAFVMTVLSAWFGTRFHEPTLPLIIGVLVLVGLTTSEYYFASAIRPLIPALQANRILTLHVTTVTAAYGLIATAGTAASLALVKGYWPATPGLPSAEKSARIAHTAALAAMPTLTLGIALGAYWAANAWGRPWGWDPKETTALITLLMLVEYVHMQSLRSWRGSRSLWVLVITFGTIIFNMAAVNFWVVGLHSYAQ